MSGYWSTWHELVCPKCSSHNFVNAGDLNDMTGFDPENCKCWACGTCFDFEGEVIDEDECCEDGEYLIQAEEGRDFRRGQEK